MAHSPGRPTAAIHTHGCKLNQADSEALARGFTEAGYAVIDWADGVTRADVLVLNTCTVTATADSKARQTLRAARRANAKAFIVATGCYVQRAGDELLRVDGVSLALGNTGKAGLVAAVTEALRQRGEDRLPQLQISGRRQEGEQRSAAVLPPAGRSRAMIKIQEGCDQVCAYCIVPKVRGRERSIAPETVVSAVNDRVAEGCQEVVLTGTQLGSYGFDIPGASLSGLIRRVLEETSAPRVRVSSLQAQEISPGLLELWQDRRLCPHFHLPLQSGCDRVLRAMRRRYDTAQFARAVELVRRMFPDAGVTADVIVGFPGEGEAEFRESRAFAASMEFSGIHVFPYSARPGTTAAHLQDREGRTPDPVKKDRVAAMSQVARAGFERFRLGQMGSIRPVLWEPARRPDVPAWSGLTDNYIRVSAQDPGALGNVITGARLLRLAGDHVESLALPA